MSIKTKYPEVRPKGLLNLLSGKKDLPINVEFSRASTGTYVDSDGLIKEAAVDEPRFSYDFDLTFKGLLKEPESTNLCWRTGAIQNGVSNYRVYGTETLQAAVSPTGQNTATDGATRVITNGTQNLGFDTYNTDYGQNQNADQTFSAFVKPVGGLPNITLQFAGNMGVFDFATETWTPLNNSVRLGFEKYHDGWYRLWASYNKSNQFWYWGMRTTAIAPAGQGMLIWGANIVNNQSNITSYIPNPATVSGGSVRAAETLDFVGLQNYSDGFSILLDYEANEYVGTIYEILASNNAVQSSIAVANGSLVWTINGVSNQSTGEYPQVGYVQGRVRNVAAYGAATGANVDNMMFASTESTPNIISSIGFPTTATVLANANKIRVGDYLNLKAIYFWNEQLNDEQAMSIVKGNENNIVLPTPDIAGATIFIFDTDNQNVNNTNVSIDIDGTNELEITWGDGQTQTTTISPITHTYPYGGKYKIQIETPSDATNGLTEFSFESNPDSLLNIEQWGNGYASGAGGAGFTGTMLDSAFMGQNRLESMPAFHHSGLTTLNQFMRNTFDFDLSDTTWVPTNIPDVTTLKYAFLGCGKNNAAGSDFPKFTTSNLLTNVFGAFQDSYIKRFESSNTGVPFTDTSGINNWSQCFQNCKELTHIGSINYNGNMYGTFKDCTGLVQFGGGDTSTVNNMVYGWYRNQSLTSFPLISFASCNTFYACWYGCTNLTSFPDVTFPNANTNLERAWGECFNLNKDWGNIDMTNVTNINSTWRGNSALAGPAGANAWWTGNGHDFPNITGSLGSPTSQDGTWANCTSLAGAWPWMDFSGIDNSIAGAWYNDAGITSFPGPLNTITAGVSLDFSNVVQFGADNQGAFHNCSGLTTFPMIDTSSATGMARAWEGCTNLDNVSNGAQATSFPLIDTSNVTDMYNTWNRCFAMTVFPQINTANVTRLGGPTSGAGCFAGFAGTQFPSLNWTGVTGDISGAWANCSNLTGFPSHNLNNCTVLGQTNQGAWSGCNSIINWPNVTYQSGTQFIGTWASCTSLTNWQNAAAFHVPGGTSATFTPLAFQNAFFNCALTAQSIENILVSLDANGSTGVTLNINGGTNTGAANWTAAANAAYNNLTSAKGWTIVFNP